MSLIFEGHDQSLDLPFVDQKMPDGTIERRFLARLPTPRDHPMMALPGIEADPALVPLPKSQWPSLAFNRVHEEVPILDQDGKGACEAFDWTSSFMLLRARAGAPYVALSPWFLYSLINGGFDGGSNAGDALQALLTTGICADALVPGQPIRPAGISAAARAGAARFKLKEAIQLTAGNGDDTIGQVLVAAAMGWNISCDVQAGGAYNTSSDGTTAFLGGRTNHAQTIGEGIRFDSQGNPQFRHRNSWGTSWGQGGFGWLTTRHILASQELYAIRSTIEDPQDPDMPPRLA